MPAADTTSRTAPRIAHTWRDSGCDDRLCRSYSSAATPPSAIALPIDIGCADLCVNASRIVNKLDAHRRKSAERSTSLREHTPHMLPLMG